ncbi:PDGLE domain-containing protein [Nocardioides sp. GY 10127]|uniref:PDGLE domain-containing protein n=1 Tax=Nocardioides sp. GY 10127 TaxID=2569762 RepID=UPI0010A7B8B9|nr:PDGLE domain-containing protein [Nocardioides sp. GY 10127]TIC81573.1 cobalt ABC transporter permease [Nocardioides sp. GY 10127]
MSRRPSLRWVAAGVLLLALVLAGVVSYYASSSPDGLESVSSEQGFADSATTSSTSDSPLAGYGVSGVGDARLSGGLAGVAGVVVVLVLAGGLTWAVRRRPRPESAEDASATREPAGSR